MSTQTTFIPELETKKILENLTFVKGNWDKHQVPEPVIEFAKTKPDLKFLMQVKDHVIIKHSQNKNFGVSIKSMLHWSPKALEKRFYIKAYDNSLHKAFRVFYLEADPQNWVEALETASIALRTLVAEHDHD